MTQLPTTCPSLDYYGARDPADAHRNIAAVRRAAPIALGPYGPEALSYRLVRAVLRDARFVMPAGNGLSAQGITSGPLWDRVCQSIVGQDGDAHRRLRRLVSRSFTPRAAARMRGACVRVSNELVGRCTDEGRCDVVADLARPYPIPIICDLLGVPPEDWHLFGGWVRGVAKAFGPDVARHETAILWAWDNMDDYLADLTERRRRSPTDDLLSGLVSAVDGDDRLSRAELLNLVAVLLVAGTDTTRNQLAAAVQVLCAHPGQWELLAGHPDLAPRVVDEVMRYAPASFSTIRVARDDLDLDDCSIPKGTFVVANTAAANRDPAVFPDPDHFDVTRQNSAAILTFGGGAHQCLGIHLAKVELAEVLAVMARRMPAICCTGPAPWRPIFGISGPTALPVEFEPGH